MNIIRIPLSPSFLLSLEGVACETTLMFIVNYIISVTLLDVSLCSDIIILCRS